jgi:hypothetical protein
LVPRCNRHAIADFLLAIGLQSLRIALCNRCVLRFVVALYYALQVGYSRSFFYRFAIAMQPRVLLHRGKSIEGGVAMWSTRSDVLCVQSAIAMQLWSYRVAIGLQSLCIALCRRFELCFAIARQLRGNSVAIALRPSCIRFAIALLQSHCNRIAIAWRSFRIAFRNRVAIALYYFVAVALQSYCN